ncbi:hypothetical protein C463_11755 [Halorubrum californiense DSM 19288]|uniref:HVO-0234-like beta-propeller domain-containing protein n=1 Tax=Halorubrum californiense DSM 19288 TaxID=1227465 RepID=M0E4H6_9EURY|nr:MULTISPECIES: hypothetical protein [Halorubrum]ELZ41943.1 hypothetical protein C463_11755 [Halorubrum californiense DSM 19288]TKX65207.1 hypothetical protein EXE40_17080 [Halorubrum sp. GN11GM_10-3_MGM]
MAPAEDDISIDEKRVYAGSAGRTDAYVATGTGIVRLSLSADKIGAFDMVARDPARDVAVLARDGGSDLVVAATPDGLSAAAVGDDPDFALADDDPAVAVGVAGGRAEVIVAREDGAIERVEFEEGGTAVVSTARLDAVADPRAVDGALVAAADGVYRVDEGGLTDVGLDDARDVAGIGMPLAATGAGLYWLGNGWMTARAGDAEAVAADGDGHAMAVVDGELLVHADAAGEWNDETWEAADLPVDETAVALGYGPGVSVAVTDAGTLCVDAGDGWRHQVVGVRDVAGVALAVVE